MNEKVQDKIDVSYVARLARVKLSPEETALFQSQLHEIVGYVRKVRELDVSGVEPTAHGIPMQNVLRKDEVVPGLQRDAVLANAPARSEEQFVVPRIVE